MARRINPPNDSKLRLAPAGTYTPKWIEGFLKEATYKPDMAKHKRDGTAYGIKPPQFPRKLGEAVDFCDEKRFVPLKEARILFERGIKAGFISLHKEPSGAPKRIWCVDSDENVYEAKPNGKNSHEFHGYRLNDDRYQRKYILNEWKRRCQKH